MKQTYFRLVIIFTVFTSIVSNAQSAFVSSGGNTNATGGLVSFSIGQLVYTATNNQNGSVLSGNQQPFEITILNVEKIEKQKINLLVYPNPTVDFLTLEIKEDNFKEMSLQLIDANGKMLIINNILERLNKIEMQNFPASYYILKVSSKTKVLKTFKIIKK